MKRILILLAIASVALAACSKKDLLPVAYIDVAEGSTFTPAEVSATGAVLTFSFTTNYQWQIRGYSKAGFCTFSEIKGDAGDATFVVNVDKNETSMVRTAEFSILAGAAEQVITITQTETNAVNVADATYSAPAEGGLVEVSVSHNVDYTVNIPEDITYVREVPGSKAMQNSTVMLQVDSNPEWIERIISGITITGKDVNGEDIVNSITITQPAGSIETIWSTVFSEDWPAVGTASPFHVATRDGKLLMTDATSIHAVDLVTGEYLEEVSVPGLEIAPQSMASDESGNVLFAANATCGAAGHFIVYLWDGSTLEPLIDYDGLANFWTGTVGNIRVVGDIDTKAVVSAVISGCNCFLAWQIENGEVTETITGSAPYINKYIGAVTNGVVCPVSDNINDGLLFIGYNGEYSLYWSGDPKAVTSSTWTAVVNPGGDGNKNYNSLSVVEYNGTRYCAVGQNDHFGWSSPTVYLFDITDMSNVTLAYTTSVAGSFVRVGADDVKLDVTDGVMRLYQVDAGNGIAYCIEFPH